jgi:ribosomal-protein-alanine N-acetyltransferase
MPGPIFLEGNDVTLRTIDESDREFLQASMNHPRVWPYARDTDPVNDRQLDEFFENVVSGEDTLHVLACDGDEPLGVVTLAQDRYGPTQTLRARRAEVAYWFDPDHHGEGYGSDAVSRMVRYAFEDRNMRRVDAHVGGFNDASIGLLESLGFQREGTLREAAWFKGEYHDVYCYGLLRSEWEGWD